MKITHKQKHKNTDTTFKPYDNSTEHTYENPMKNHRQSNENNMKIIEQHTANIKMKKNTKHM